jgi:hypothetical protein
MIGTIKNITVNKMNFKVWSDFIKKGTFAENENGEVKMIKGNGYLSNELSIRKSIAIYFNLPTFRK